MPPSAMPLPPPSTTPVPWPFPSPASPSPHPESPSMNALSPAARNPPRWPAASNSPPMIARKMECATATRSGTSSDRRLQNPIHPLLPSRNPTPPQRPLDMQIERAAARGVAVAVAREAPVLRNIRTPDPTLCGRGDFSVKNAPPRSMSSHSSRSRLDATSPSASSADPTPPRSLYPWASWPRMQCKFPARFCKGSCGLLWAGTGFSRNNWEISHSKSCTDSSPASPCARAPGCLLLTPWQTGSAARHPERSRT